MVVLGISAQYHDASVCLFEDGKISFASQTERFSRIKNDKHLNSSIFKEIFRYASPSHVIWYEKPYKRFLRKALFDKKIDLTILNWRQYLQQYVDTRRVVTVSHHIAHAASCLYTAPFNPEGSIVFSIDAVGELYTTVVYKVVNNTLKLVERLYYPNSLGLFYSAFTDMVGLKPNEDEYILMGMASYGDPEKYYSIINDAFFHTKGISLKYNFNKGCRGLLQIHDEQDRFDIAAAVQRIYEERLVDYIKSKLLKYKTSNIMLGGGCALNCSANTKLLDIVDNIHIFPHPGDGGSSVGACLSFTKCHIDMKHNFWGYDAGMSHTPESVVQEILTKGYSFVINGKAEFGPRALGNRSILADPRSKAMQDKINNIKGRELFRPFAPCILKKYFDTFFETRGLSESPYMQYTLKCKNPEIIPAVVHVDGTSRVQTVDYNNKFLYNVLKIWYKKTGVPVLLNTSLNKKGKPLINTPNNMIEFN